MNSRVSCLVCLSLLLSACAEYQTYTPAPIDTEQTTREYRDRNLADPEIRNWLEENNHPQPQWPRKTWDIQNLIQVAYLLNPELAIAKARVKAAEARLITAGQNPEPGIEVSTEHHSRQENGVSPWTIGAIFNWVYEKPEKRQTRIDYAKAMVEVERLRQFEVKWHIRDVIIDHYLDTITATHKKEMLLKEKSVLEEGLKLLQRSRDLGQSSDFELSSTRLEIQRTRLAISEVEAELRRAQSKLALSVGLPANGLDTVELTTSEFIDLPDPNKSRLQTEELQARALVERPDVLRVLSEYVVAEAALHKEIENQFPNITLSPGFIFDQNDNIWVLAGSWLLPVTRNRGPIAEAEARRKVKEQEFLAYQTKVLQEVHEARIGYETALDTLSEAKKLVDEVQTALKKISQQYDRGFTDRLSLIRAQLEVLLAQRSSYLLEIEAWRAFNRLEDAVMTRLTEH